MGTGQLFSFSHTGFVSPPPPPPQYGNRTTVLFFPYWFCFASICKRRVLHLAVKSCEIPFSLFFLSLFFLIPFSQESPLSAHGDPTPLKVPSFLILTVIHGNPTPTDRLTLSRSHTRSPLFSSHAHALSLLTLTHALVPALTLSCHLADAHARLRRLTVTPFHALRHVSPSPALSHALSHSVRHLCN